MDVLTVPCLHLNAALAGALPNGRAVWACPDCRRACFDGDSEWFEPPEIQPNPIFGGAFGRYRGMTVKKVNE